MRCPACPAEMFVLEYESVEVDYCPECRGVWLDSGELTLLGESAGVVHRQLLDALAQGDAAPGGGRKRRCPVCGKSMTHVIAGGETAIEVDRCPRGHGLWFDRGELRSVIEAAGAERDGPLIRLLDRLDRNVDAEEDSS